MVLSCVSPAHTEIKVLSELPDLEVIILPLNYKRFHFQKVEKSLLMQINLLH